MEEELLAEAPKELGVYKVYLDMSHKQGTEVFISAYSELQKSDWCKITPGKIDVACRLRADMEISRGAFDKATSVVMTTLYDNMLNDYADLFLNVVGEDESDPLLHYGINARFLPRDVTRNLIKRSPTLLAGMVDENSSFRNEDWFPKDLT